MVVIIVVCGRVVIIVVIIVVSIGSSRTVSSGSSVGILQTELDIINILTKIPIWQLAWNIAEYCLYWEI